MHPRIAGLVLTGLVATSVEAQQWELTLISRGDSMFTDLQRIERVAPHVYRAWSRYVYVRRPTVNSDAEALVQKEYDCRKGTRQVLSAVFYDGKGVVTWESTEPGPRTAVTRRKGRRQWSQVCSRVEGRLPGNLISWLKITLRGSTS